MEFIPFDKISRLKRNCTITEKVDGMNGQIVFGPEGELLVGSRSRQIWPEGTPGRPKGCDNFGFAHWVYANRHYLFAYLGEGRHYGEWAGAGIQRGYSLNHKRFFLFNTNRWVREAIPSVLFNAGLDTVPLLYRGGFSTDVVDAVLDSLSDTGSKLHRFCKPEGIVVYHHASHTYFKVTLDGDGHKGPASQSPS